MYSENHRGRNNKKKALRKSSDYIENDHQKNVYSLFLFFVIIGIGVLSQTTTPTSPHFHKAEKLVTQKMLFVDFGDAEKITATLIRLMNTIDLLNTFHNTPELTKHVLMEVLDVKDILPFDSINISILSDAVHVIKSLDLMPVRKRNTALDMLAAENMNFSIPDDLFLSDKSSRGIQFPINYSQLNISGFFSTTKALTFNMIHLFNELNSSAQNASNIDFYAKNIFTIRSDHESLLVKFGPILDVDIVSYVNSWENLSSISGLIEAYQKWTKRFDSNNFYDSLMNLKSSGETVETLSKSYDIKHIRQQLQLIFELVSTKVHFSKKKHLISFQQGFKETDMLFDDLKKEWLRNFLNAGKSLVELLYFLLPISFIKDEVYDAEMNKWNNYSAKNMWSSLIYRSSMNLKNIEEFPATSFLNSMVNVEANLQHPIGILNILTLNDLKTFVNSSEALIVFYDELKRIVNTSTIEHGKVNYSMLVMEYSFLNNSEKVIKLRNTFFSGEYYSKLKFMNTSVSCLDEEERKFGHLLNKTSEFKNLLTNETLTKMREIVQFPQKYKSQIMDMKKMSEQLNSLSPLTKEERKIIEELPDFMLSGKQIVDKWNKTNFKTEIIKTQGFDCASRVPGRKDIVSQLVYTQHTLALLQKRDLHQSIQRFLTRGIQLAEKVKSLPGKLQIYLVYDWNKFVSLNQSMSTFVSDIKQLPSNFSIQNKNLQAFGDALSILDDVNIPCIEFYDMIESLVLLRNTTLGQSKEVYDVEQSLEELKDLQYAVLRKKKALSGLLKEADFFHLCFYSKVIEYESKWEILPLILVSLGGIMASVLSSFIAWVLYSLQNRDYYQEQIDLGIGQYQKKHPVIEL